MMIRPEGGFGLLKCHLGTGVREAIYGTIPIEADMPWLMSVNRRVVRVPDANINVVERVLIMRFDCDGEEGFVEEQTEWLRIEPTDDPAALSQEFIILNFNNKPAAEVTLPTRDVMKSARMTNKDDQLAASAFLADMIAFVKAPYHAVKVKTFKQDGVVVGVDYTFELRPVYATLDVSEILKEV